MARQNTAWLEYRGQSSLDYGVRIMDGPLRALPLERGEPLTAAGRDGTLWRGDGSRASVDIRRTLRVPRSRLDAALAWLDAPGTLRFSDAPDRLYSARVNRGQSARAAIFEAVAPGADPLMEGQVTFTCDPFPHLYPPAAPIEIAASGTRIENPGTAEALPKVTIVGSGDFSVTIGAQTLFFQGVEEGVIVDSELGDALTLDGALLANDQVDGALWRLPPGPAYVTWLAGGADDAGGDSAGSVTSVTIDPRWRCL